jgi:hypothetical protein
MPGFMGSDKPTGPIKEGKDITQYVSDLVRLNLIAEKVIGKEPLSRGTRESHFVEAWLHAVSRQDQPDRQDCVRLNRCLALVYRMRELSPHEEGKHIEVIRDLLKETPNSVQVLGSPYDTPTEGMMTGILNRIKGKKPEGQ